MAGDWTSDVAVLVLRVAVGYVFLYAAWKNTESTAAWQWTVNERRYCSKILTRGGETNWQSGARSPECS